MDGSDRFVFCAVVVLFVLTLFGAVPALMVA